MAKFNLYVAMLFAAVAFCYAVENGMDYDISEAEGEHDMDKGNMHFLMGLKDIFNKNGCVDTCSAKPVCDVKSPEQMGACVGCVSDCAQETVQAICEHENITKADLEGSVTDALQKVMSQQCKLGEFVTSGDNACVPPKGCSCEACSGEAGYSAEHMEPTGEEKKAICGFMKCAYDRLMAQDDSAPCGGAAKYTYAGVIEFHFYDWCMADAQPQA